MMGSLFGGSWIEQRGLAIPYGRLDRAHVHSDSARPRRPRTFWVAAAVVVAAGAGNGVAVVTNACSSSEGHA
jgi:hypothetical protein